MNRRVTRQQCPQSGDGGHGVFVETQQVPHDALIQLDSHGIYGALMEGLKLTGREVLPDC